ncbi:hypothetical protein [Methylobacterium sp. A54F]
MSHDSMAKILRRLYSADLPSFCKFALAETTATGDVAGNLHIDVMANALQECLDRGKTRLILNLPPRSHKTHCASIAMPVFALGRDPTRRLMIVAGSRALASDLKRRALALMRTPRCRALFPYLNPKDLSREIVLPHGGGIFYASVGQSLIGRGADIIVVDDPISPSQATDDARRRGVNEWYDAEIVPRLNNKAEGITIIAMQRLHQDDLTGHVRQRQTWHEIVLPAVALRDETWPLCHRRPVTRKLGEALRPRHESHEQLIEILKDIGAFNFSAQYLQSPSSNSAEVRTVFLWSPRPTNWSPEMGLGDGGFYTLSEVENILHSVFGIGDPPYRTSEEPYYTEEEWSQSTMIQQAQLIKETRSSSIE